MSMTASRARDLLDRTVMWFKQTLVSRGSVFLGDNSCCTCSKLPKRPSSRKLFHKINGIIHTIRFKRLSVEWDIGDFVTSQGIFIG